VVSLLKFYKRGWVFITATNNAIGLLKIQNPDLLFTSTAPDTLIYSETGYTYQGLGNSIFSTQGNTGCWNGIIWALGVKVQIASHI